ncbi:hypothetical protein GQ607_004867 [Colletotrichum asianum]|uniref:Uncharacterized protein n=1 Tax=Colletotrichum asianum TaxID=702518 RepID=A0A8H3WFY2_9PEZI|nr:hypothetical protein GQ607_004867 [Colletotrichum asianum]
MGETLKYKIYADREPQPRWVFVEGRGGRQSRDNRRQDRAGKQDTRGGSKRNNLLLDPDRVKKLLAVRLKIAAAVVVVGVGAFPVALADAGPRCGAAAPRWFPLTFWGRVGKLPLNSTQWQQSANVVTEPSSFGSAGHPVPPGSPTNMRCCDSTLVPSSSHLSLTGTLFMPIFW